MTTKGEDLNQNKDQDTSENDGRNYFRLNNAMGIAAFQVEQLTAPDYYQDGYDSRLDVPPILSLLNQSRESQIDNNTLLKQIRGKSANVGRYLERLNDRLDLLQKAILYIDHSFPKLSWQWVNYSEAGIDFYIPKAAENLPSPLREHVSFAPGDLVHLILGIADPDLDIALDTDPDTMPAILPKSHELYHPQSSPGGFVSVVARITAIDDETLGQRLGCAFERITDFDRQYLARHILAVQSFRRRKSFDD